MSQPVKGHWRLMFPNDYVNAADLQGADVAVVIDQVINEKLRGEDGNEEWKHVLTFKGEKKKLVLNKTNAKMIAKLHGNEVSAWPGRAITLWPTTCKAFGETVDCIRVRPEVPKRRRKPKGAPPPEEPPRSNSPEDVGYRAELPAGIEDFPGEDPPHAPAVEQLKDKIRERRADGAVGEEQAAIRAELEAGNVGVDIRARIGALPADAIRDELFDRYDRLTREVQP